jgi:sulfite dehydrogenase (quinone) subunit SoeC
MHPALSLVVFTTASGAGYGLLVVLGLGSLLGGLPQARPSGWLAMGLALALVTAGLLASTLHLRHPERAWRSFSQWRSSWLSREGVAAVLTYLPSLVFAYGWAVEGEIWRAAAFLSAIGALATLGCTGQIYASLKPIARWHHPLTTPVYLALGLATGGLAASAALRLGGATLVWLDVLALLLLPVAWGLKLAWWRSTDRGGSIATAGSATGLGHFGRVRLLEPPHTGSSYLTEEMGFQIARKHARKLRRIALGMGLLLPWALLALAALLGRGALPALLVVAAFLAAMAGTLVERWLFFAEARHTVVLYYGAETA